MNVKKGFQNMAENKETDLLLNLEDEVKIRR